jgi:hypothetical protein
MEMFEAQLLIIYAGAASIAAQQKMKDSLHCRTSERLMRRLLKHQMESLFMANKRLSPVTRCYREEGLISLEKFVMAAFIQGLAKHLLIIN